MDGLDGQHALRHVKASVGLAQDVLAHEQRHHVATREVLHEQVQILLILQCGGTRVKQAAVKTITLTSESSVTVLPPARYSISRNRFSSSCQEEGGGEKSGGAAGKVMTTVVEVESQQANGDVWLSQHAGTGFPHPVKEKAAVEKCLGSSGYSSGES